MDHEEILQNNIELFAANNAKAAVKLGYVDESHLTFCKSKKNELNLKQKKEGKTIYYHSQNGVMDEAEEWLRKIGKPKFNILIVYGIGLGYTFDVLKEWLKEDPDRILLYIEDDLAVIHRFLETPHATTILEHPQVYVHYIEAMLENDPVFNYLTWKFYDQPLQIVVSPAYEKYKKNQAEYLKMSIPYELTIKHYTITEYLNFGAMYFKSFYPNLLELHQSRMGTSLFGKFKHVPAIICGAGPSLKKNIKLLSTLTDKALIFAGGSAMNALGAHSIMPHFGGGIDPNPPQLDRLETNSAFEVPYFYRNRMYHRAFKLIHGPKLYINAGDGYFTAEWFEKEIGIYNEPIEEGHNVINFCMEIARFFGCNPIILVGMDLGFSESKSYAPGVVDDLSIPEDIRKELIERKDIHGKKMYTVYKWIAESDWIADFGMTHQDITLINASEGGLGFYGVKNKTLKEVSEHYLTHSYDFMGWIHTEIQNAESLESKKELIEQKIKEIWESLIRCQVNLANLILDAKQVQEMNESGKDVPKALHTGLAALYETELSEEPAYKAIVEIFNIVFQHLYNAEYQTIVRPKEPIDQQEKNRRLLNLHIRKYEFLLNAAKSNELIIEKTLQGEIL